MNRRRLIGMAAGVFAGSTAIGTGAISSSRAERSITAEVANDSEAYLSIDSENVGVAGRSSQVNLGNNGKVATFRIPGPEDDLIAGTDPNGVGLESEYWFENMARIQNQGHKPISVYSDCSGDLDQIAIFDINNNSRLLTSHSDGRSLDVGESFIFGIYIETGDQPIAKYNENLAIIGEQTSITTS